MELNDENKLFNSFRLVKSDIISMQNELVGLSQAQERLLEEISKLKASNARLKQKSSLKRIKIKKVQHVSAKRAKKHYVAAKGSKKFHVKECPFAQNIMPKHKINLKSKTGALNLGFKPCKCV